MNAVMLSIRPEWCEKIVNGRKTIEIRKTKPKLETPFKCYIYCTYGLGLIEYHDGAYPNMLLSQKVDSKHIWGNCCNGKVIGEFVCDKIFDIGIEISSPDDLPGYPFPGTGLTDKEIMQYLGNGKMGYGWHISELKIYDKPKALSEFITVSEAGCCNEGKCRGCHYLDRGNGFNTEDDCTADFDTDNYKPLRKAPQSWCYVEGASDE